MAELAWHNQETAVREDMTAKAPSTLSPSIPKQVQCSLDLSVLTKRKNGSACPELMPDILLLLATESIIVAHRPSSNPKRISMVQLYYIFPTVFNL